MWIAEWLEPIRREGTGFAFVVTDLVETGEIPSQTDLTGLMEDSYWGLEYLGSLAERYGFDAVKDRFLHSRGGTIPTVRRGDFGEAVTATLLQQFEGYCVPIQKLRFKISSNQTLPGSDCMALRVSEGELTEVAFVETKFRSTYDSTVAIKGTKQLESDAQTALPEIVTFMARRLKEQKHPLAVAVESYMFDRNTDLDSFVLVLIHERTSWSERVLSNLQEDEIELEPLHVYVAKIDNLIDISNQAFSSLNVEVTEHEA